MKGLRKLAQRKAPKPRPGLDDPAHKQRIRLMDCVLKGRRCTVGRWKGVHPHKVWVEEEYAHVCSGRMEAHHTTRKAQRGHDHTVVPLCLTAHRELHDLGPREVQKRWRVALPVMASALAPHPRGA